MSALGMGTAILGAAIGSGEKVKIPDYLPVDIAQTQAKTTAGNISNLPAAEKLASGVNMFNQAQLEKMLSMQIPGYSDMLAGGGKAINDLLAGKLPSDVVSSTLRAANAKGWGSGWAGGTMKANLGLRDLGLTSLQATERGISSAMAWLQMAKSVAVAPQFNVASQFVSPEFGIQTTINENRFKWGVDLQKAEIAAQADPFDQAVGGIMIGIGGQMAGAGLQGVADSLGGMSNAPSNDYLSSGYNPMTSYAGGMANYPQPSGFGM